MPWVQSHSNLRGHPKLKRAARMAGCSQPEMAGHLHFLWWWALDTQPDGDLSAYDPEDIAEAAGFTGDADLFVTALVDCGPGDKHGFLDPDMTLHDWDEYGGAYRRKVEAGRQSAKRRWERDKAEKPEPDDANLMPTHMGDDGYLMGTQWVPNTEERRGEERRTNHDSDDNYAKRLAASLREQGITIRPGGTLHESYRNLLTEAWKASHEDKHHGITLGLIAEFVRSAQDIGMTSEARSHTARLIKTHDRMKVFDAYGEALQWGAGIGDKYASDPLALSKYVAAIVGGKR
jgi:hypothetical protein